MTSKKTKQKIAGFQNAQNIQNYELALDDFNTRKLNDEILRKTKDAAARDQWKANEEIRQLGIKNQMKAYDRSQEVYNQTLKAVDFYADTAEKRVQLGLDEQIAKLSFDLDDLEREFDKEVSSSIFQTNEQQSVIDNAITNNKNELAEIRNRELLETIDFDSKKKDLENQQANLAKTFEIRQEMFDNQKAMVQQDFNYGSLEQTIEAIQMKGSAAARGTKGKGATKMLQSFAAIAGLNQQQMADQLYRSKQSVELEREQATQQNIFEKATLKNQQSTLNKNRAQVFGESGTYNIQRTVSESRKTQGIEQAKRQKKRIAELLGISQEEMALSTEKLAQSIVSAQDKAKIDLQKVAATKFETKSAAYAQRMLEPSFKPMAPKPYKTPKTVFVEPKRPLKTPKGLAGGGGAAQPNQPSAIGTALSIGGGVLAAGAAAGVMGPIAAIAAPILGGLGSLFG